MIFCRADADQMEFIIAIKYQYIMELMRRRRSTVQEEVTPVMAARRCSFCS
jgi:hypothetical protein